MQTSSESVPAPPESRPGHVNWHINRAIRVLETSPLLTGEYGALVSDIIGILRRWSDAWAGRPEWSHFVNCKGFLHEVEEALVPLHALGQHCLALDGAGHSRSAVTVVDLCCGKGMFSMLLSALADVRPSLTRHVRRIIMVEKQATIRWGHTEHVNSVVGIIGSGFAIPLLLWNNSNIFSDDFSSSLRLFLREADSGEAAPVKASAVLVGIHLCRRLSSRFVELANTLEEGRVTAAVLAPCCLPRLGGGGALCSVCIPASAIADSDMPHPPTEKERSEKLDIIYKTCWKCGDMGHSRGACTSDSEDLQLTIKKLWKKLEAADEHATDRTTMACEELNLNDLSQLSNPFKGWCDFLFNSLRTNSGQKKLLDINLDVPTGHTPTFDDVSSRSAHNTSSFNSIEEGAVPPSKKQKREQNWNANRKMTWIICSRL